MFEELGFRFFRIFLGEGAEYTGSYTGFGDWVFFRDEEFDLDLRAEFDLDLLTEFDLDPDRDDDDRDRNLDRGSAKFIVTGRRPSLYVG